MIIFICQLFLISSVLKIHQKQITIHDFRTQVIVQDSLCAWRKQFLDLVFAAKERFSTPL